MSIHPLNSIEKLPHYLRKIRSPDYYCSRSLDYLRSEIQFSLCKVNSPQIRKLGNAFVDFHFPNAGFCSLMGNYRTSLEITFYSLQSYMRCS